MRAPHDSGVMHAWHLDVVHVGRRPGDEARILPALDALSDQRFSFGSRRRHALRSHFRCRGFDGVHNMLVPSASADVALQTFTDFLLCGTRISLQNLLHCHDHSWSAETALRSVLIPESLLHRMIAAVSGKAFDGHDFAAVRLNGEHGAALDRLAVDLDRARAANRGLAPDMRTREADHLTQVMNQQQSWFDLV